MPNWTDTLKAREEGNVDGFVGNNVDPDAPKETEPEQAPEEQDRRPV